MILPSWLFPSFSGNSKYFSYEQTLALLTFVDERREEHERRRDVFCCVVLL